MQSKLTSVPEFLKSLPDDRRQALTKLRALVRKGLPKLKETMRYGMPSYEDSSGGVRIAFNSQRQYLALYICDADVLKAHKKDLGKLDCGKSCVRFRAFDQLPAGVVERMLDDVARLLKHAALAALVLTLALMTVPGARADAHADKPATASHANQQAAAAPAVAAAQKPAGLPPGLPAWHPPAEYSEDMIMKSGDQTMTMHRHIQGDKIRTEMALEDEQLVMIEKGGESYQIMPSHKMTMKMPASQMAPVDSSGPPPEVRIEPLGTEKLNGRDALKYRISSQGQDGLAWFDPTTGAPLKMQTNDASIEWANFSAGTQATELFELPKDYQTIDLEQIQSAMGGAGAGLPTLPPGAITNAQGAMSIKSAKQGPGGMPMPVGGPTGAMSGMGGAGGGVSGLAQQMGSHFGQSMGEKFGAGLGAQFGPLGSTAGSYIGGRVGSWLGAHAAKMVTGGGGGNEH